MARWWKPVVVLVTLPGLYFGGCGCCLFPLVAVLSVGSWATQHSGLRDIPFVAEFDRLYPGADHSISYYTGTHGSTTWNSTVGLHGRYVLSLHCGITLNRTRTRVVTYGKPTFYLKEVTRVQAGDGGQTLISSGEQVKFGLDQWRKLVEAGGDLRALGIEVKTDAPVPGLRPGA